MRTRGTESFGLLRLLVWTFVAAIALAALGLGIYGTVRVNQLWSRRHAPSPSHQPSVSRAPSSSRAPSASHAPSSSPFPSTECGSISDICNDVIAAQTEIDELIIVTEVIQDTLSMLCTGEVLAHTVSGVISPTACFQTLAGAGITPVIPPPSFPTIEFPLNAISNVTHDLVQGRSYSFPPGLVLTTQGLWVDLIDGGGGETIIQIGYPETYSTGTYGDLVHPHDNEGTGILLSVDFNALAPGASAVTLDLIPEWSSESGYDFLTVTGPISLRQSGPGPSAGDPYNTQEFDGVTMYPGAPLSVFYQKDGAFRMGVDNAALRIRNAHFAAVAPEAPIGSAGLNMVLPSDLTAYIGRQIVVCANDDNLQTINLTGTGLSWDRAGLYTELQFVGGHGCCVTLLASSATRIGVHTSHTSCVAFCQSNGRGCTTAIDVLSSADSVIELAASTTFPSTHHNVLITAPSASVFVIPCDDLDLYVGKHYTVSTQSVFAHRLIIVPGANPCGANFQLGNTLDGRTFAPIILLDADPGAGVKFSVVSSEQIVVTMTQNVRHCDYSGNCAPVGEQLNLFAGWWRVDNDWDLSSLPTPTGVLLHISDSAAQDGQNKLHITLYQGPPTMQHVANIGIDTYNILQYNLGSSLSAEITAPFEISLGSPGPFVQMAQIDPNNPSQLFFQQYPWGINPFPRLIVEIWNPRATDFNPYLIYRRVGDPFASGSTQRDGSPISVGTSNFMPLDNPDRTQRGYGFRDTRLLFEYYVGTELMVMTADALNEEPGNKWCDGTDGYRYGIDLASRMKSGTPIVITTNLVRAQRTATSRRVTLIETDVWNSVNPFSRVTIAGVSGPWAAINGVHRVSLWCNGVKKHLPGTIDDGPDPANRSLHYYFEIDFDSSRLPVDDNRTGFVLLDGTATVTHGPVTSGMEYQPFMDAILYWMHEVFWESTHHFPRVIAYTSEDSIDRICRFTADTWKQVQDDIDTNPYGVHGQDESEFSFAFDPATFVIRISQRRNNEAVSSLYPNGFGFEFTSLATGDYSREFNACVMNQVQSFRYITLENDPSGITSEPLVDELFKPEFQMNATLNYHIPMENYLESDSVVYYAWHTAGTPTFDPLGIEFTAAFSYPPFDGSAGAYFVGDVVPWNELPDINSNFISGSGPLNGNCTFHASCVVSACDDGICESYYEFLRDTLPMIYLYYRTESFCGIINRSFTGAKTIAYCNYHDTAQGDPFNYLTAAPMAPPPWDTSANPRLRREAASALFAPMMQYLFSTYGSDHVIIDIRGNNGGSFIFQQTLTEFFGGDRNRTHGSMYTPRGDKQIPRGQYKDMFDPYFLTTYLFSDQEHYQYPELNEAHYPGSTNPGASPFIVSDWSSASGGDLFLQAFSGDTLDGNLGAGTQAHVVGNPVGTLFGCNGGIGPKLPMMPDSYFLKDKATGRPLPPIYLSLDRWCGAEPYPDRTTPTCMRANITFPFALPTLPGVGGGPAPPHDTENLWWPDIGYMPNPRLRLPGDNRPQTPTHRGNWRDAWLEASIYYLSYDAPAKKRTDDAEIAAYYARVSQHLENAARSEGTRAVHGSAKSCKHATVSLASIPRHVVATLRAQPLHNEIGHDGRSYVDVNGKQITALEAQVLLIKELDVLLAEGKLCLDHAGGISATSFLTSLPHIAIQHGHTARAA